MGGSETRPYKRVPDRNRPKDPMPSGGGRSGRAGRAGAGGSACGRRHDQPHVKRGGPVRDGLTRMPARPRPQAPISVSTMSNIDRQTGHQRADSRPIGCPLPGFQGYRQTGNMSNEFCFPHSHHGYCKAVIARRTGQSGHEGPPVRSGHGLTDSTATTP